MQYYGATQILQDQYQAFSLLMFMQCKSKRQKKGCNILCIGCKTNDASPIQKSNLLYYFKLINSDALS